MLKFVLIATACLVTSIPCYAYVQPGAMPDARARAPQAEQASEQESEAAPTVAHAQRGERLPQGRSRRVQDGLPQDVTSPSVPVPEPSVVLLTSMGLLALGVATRKRYPR